jgi:hypothetical protein
MDTLFNPRPARAGDLFPASRFRGRFRLPNPPAEGRLANDRNQFPDAGPKAFAMFHQSRAFMIAQLDPPG